MSLFEHSWRKRFSVASFFLLQYFSLFFWEFFEGKSYQRPLIPLNPMLPPLLLLNRYLSNWRSKSWKLFGKHFTGISQIGGAGPGNYGKYLRKKTGKYERCFLNSSQLSFVIFSSRLSGWSSDKYSHRPQSLISICPHHK